MAQQKKDQPNQPRVPAQRRFRPGLKCFQCGDWNHFIKDCPHILPCSFCNKKGHDISQCYYKKGIKTMIGDFGGDKELKQLSNHLIQEIKVLQNGLISQLKLINENELIETRKINLKAEKELKNLYATLQKEKITAKEADEIKNRILCNLRETKVRITNKWYLQKQMLKKKCKDVLFKVNDSIKGIYIYIYVQGYTCDYICM